MIRKSKIRINDREVTFFVKDKKVTLLYHSSLQGLEDPGAHKQYLLVEDFRNEMLLVEQRISSIKSSDETINNQELQNLQQSSSLLSPSISFINGIAISEDKPFNNQVLFYDTESDKLVWRTLDESFFGIKNSPPVADLDLTNIVCETITVKNFIWADDATTYLGDAQANYFHATKTLSLGDSKTAYLAADGTIYANYYGLNDYGLLAFGYNGIAQQGQLTYYTGNSSRDQRFVLNAPLHSLIYCQDTSSSNPAPNNSTFNRVFSINPKMSSVVSAPSAGTNYGSTILIATAPSSSTICLSGAHHQIHLNERGIYWRQGLPSASTWSDWTAIVESGSTTAHTHNYGMDGIFVCGGTSWRYYLPPNPWFFGGGYSLSSAATTTGRLYCLPLISSRSIRIDSVAVEQGAGSDAGGARLGIYNDNGQTRPGSLLTDMGEILWPAGASWVSASTNVFLSANTLYWAVVNYSAGNHYVRGPGSSAQPTIFGWPSGINGTTPGSTLYICVQAYGAMPDPAPAGTMYPWLVCPTFFYHVSGYT